MSKHPRLKDEHEEAPVLKNFTNRKTVRSDPEGKAEQNGAPIARVLQGATQGREGATPLSRGLYEGGGVRAGFEAWARF